MENQFQKVVNVAYLALAVLLAFLSLTLMMKLSSTFDLESKVKAIELIVRGVSVAIGGLVFFGLYSNQKTNVFMNEVAVELLTKVSWPTAKDTYSATAVVIITVIFAGIVLSVADWVFTVALQNFWGFAQRLFF